MTIQQMKQTALMQEGSVTDFSRPGEGERLRKYGEKSGKNHMGNGKGGR